jgi:hypothetical protein
MGVISLFSYFSELLLVCIQTASLVSSDSVYTYFNVRYFILKKEMKEMEAQYNEVVTFQLSVSWYCSTVYGNEWR